jgi:hypothetical protein
MVDENSLGHGNIMEMRKVDDDWRVYEGIIYTVSRLQTQISQMLSNMISQLFCPPVFSPATAFFPLRRQRSFTLSEGGVHL